jgi:hypothetical protein
MEAPNSGRDFVLKCAGRNPDVVLRLVLAEHMD